MLSTSTAGIRPVSPLVSTGPSAHAMDPDQLNDEVLSRITINRRELVRRLVIGTAFAVPVVSSFDMLALTTSSAEALTPNQLGFGGGNQTFAAPTITSAASATFIARHHDSFDLVATGGPDPSLAVGGQLPKGVSLVDNGNGTGALSGTPAAGSGGVYHLEVTAANGLPPSASQAFTLTVDESPAFVSASSNSFVSSQPGSFLLVATGFPVPSIALSGRLPHGLNFAANAAQGTAVISGLPTRSGIGRHKLTLTAANGVSPSASQVLTLTIRAPTAEVDNQLTVTGAQVGRDGKLTFRAAVEATGSITAVVTASGQGLVGQAHGTVRRPGSARLEVSPNAAGRRLFRRAPASHELVLIVMFAPSGGSPRTVWVPGLRPR
jgi:Putative Ig domain